MTNIALQLFSVNDEAEKDFKAMLKKVASMGYSGVEFAGYGGLEAKELNELLLQLNLKVAGSHIGFDQFETNIDGIIDFAKAIGNKNLVCSMDAVKGVENMESLEKLAEVLENAAKKAAEEGLNVSYHNHGHEFEKFGDEYVFDILFEKAPSVGIELDIYWVTKAGLDPLDYINKYKNRLRLIHLKDMDENTGESTEIGNGIIDMQSILDASSGVEWFIVEQEHFKNSSYESAQNCIDRLKEYNFTL